MTNQRAKEIQIIKSMSVAALKKHVWQWAKEEGFEGEKYLDTVYSEILWWIDIGQPLPRWLYSEVCDGFETGKLAREMGWPLA